ncbi:unnamed protein product [Peronospora farinosa]|uniref:Uncharacterized protein n=1 Tax=Peronospora farinosa TaxID=134698 RepID=A0AAV0T8D2_9STRA|nr:unnamed protein product [Peronospora farinosa]CAI5716858.1 unnamed protein product [Peronospora farinosa]
MRFSLFLLLVTFTCIACDSIVASSKDLIQVKTVDTNFQHERTDGIRRKLREGAAGEVVGAQEAEKLTETLGNIKGGAETLVPNADVMAKKIGVLEKMKGYSSSTLKQFIAFLKRIFGKSHKQLEKPLQDPTLAPPIEESKSLATNKEIELEKSTEPVEEGKVSPQKVTAEPPPEDIAELETAHPVAEEDNVAKVTEPTKEVAEEHEPVQPVAEEDNVAKVTEPTKEVAEEHEPVQPVAEEADIFFDAEDADIKTHSTSENHRSSTSPTVIEKNVVQPKSGKNAEIHAGEGESDTTNLAKGEATGTTHLKNGDNAAGAGQRIPVSFENSDTSSLNVELKFELFQILANIKYSLTKSRWMRSKSLTKDAAKEEKVIPDAVEV